MKLIFLVILVAAGWWLWHGPYASLVDGVRTCIHRTQLPETATCLVALLEDMPALDFVLGVLWPFLVAITTASLFRRTTPAKENQDPNQDLEDLLREWDRNPY